MEEYHITLNEDNVIDKKFYGIDTNHYHTKPPEFICVYTREPAVFKCPCVKKGYTFSVRPCDLTEYIYDVCPHCTGKELCDGKKCKSCRYVESKSLPPVFHESKHVLFKRLLEKYPDTRPLFSPPWCILSEDRICFDFGICSFNAIIQVDLPFNIKGGIYSKHLTKEEEFRIALANNNGRKIIRIYSEYLYNMTTKTLNEKAFNELVAELESNSDYNAFIYEAGNTRRLVDIAYNQYLERKNILSYRNMVKKSYHESLSLEKILNLDF